MEKSKSIGVFVKYPVPGYSKTRLSKTLGNTEGSNVGLYLLGHLIHHTLQETDFNVVFFCDPVRTLTDYAEWMNSNFDLCLQEGADLGSRLANAQIALFERGSTQILLIGTDCLVTPLHFETAFSHLRDGSDVVLGPAEDGGYYLIGTQTPTPQLFHEIPWSTPKTLSATLSKASRCGMRVSLLSVERDVDTEEDWNWTRDGCDLKNETTRNLLLRKT